MSLTEASTLAPQTPVTEIDPVDSGHQAKSTMLALVHRARRLRRTELINN